MIRLFVVNAKSNNNYTAINELCEQRNTENAFKGEIIGSLIFLISAITLDHHVFSMKMDMSDILALFDR